MVLVVVLLKCFGNRRDRPSHHRIASHQSHKSHKWNEIPRTQELRYYYYSVGLRASFSFTFKCCVGQLCGCRKMRVVVALSSYWERKLCARLNTKHIRLCAFIILLWCVMYLVVKSDSLILVPPDVCGFLWLMGLYVNIRLMFHSLCIVCRPKMCVRFNPRQETHSSHNATKATETRGASDSIKAGIL